MSGPNEGWQLVGAGGWCLARGWGRLLLTTNFGARPNFKKTNLSKKSKKEREEKQQRNEETAETLFDGFSVCSWMKWKILIAQPVCVCVGVCTHRWATGHGNSLQCKSIYAKRLIGAPNRTEYFTYLFKIFKSRFTLINTNFTWLLQY